MGRTPERSGQASGPRAMPGDRPPWTVLFIGEHGKVIPFKRAKMLVGVAAAAFAMALAAVVVLAVVNHTLHRRTQELQQSLTASGRTIGELRHERDLLTAQVVLVETKMKETLAGVVPRPIEREEQRLSPAKDGPLPGDEGKPDLNPAAEQLMPAVQPPVGMSEGLFVEGFQLQRRAQSNTLELTYKISNASHGQKTLAGNVVVVLKGEGIEPEQWLTLPDVGLVRGRPAHPQKGYSFNIRHAKVFEHAAALSKEPLDYTHAVLYVFSKRGELMTAQEYPVRLTRASP